VEEIKKLKDNPKLLKIEKKQNKNNNWIIIKYIMINNFINNKI
jgi:hypothetical protein